MYVMDPRWDVQAGLIIMEYGLRARASMSQKQDLVCI